MVCLAGLRRLFQLPDEHEPEEGFVSFFDPGWSLVQLRELLREHGDILSLQGWYNKESFALATSKPCYRQVRAGPIAHSFNKTYAEQCALLPTGEDVPPARIAVLGIVCHFLKTSERLLPDLCLRTADTDSLGCQVEIGIFDADGLHLYYLWQGCRGRRLGLAAMRR